MLSLLKLTIIDFKLYLRNTIATFFTLAFPLLMLLLFGSIYGNQPAEMFGERGTVDISVPGYIATLIIGTAAFLSLPIDLALQRQLGVLRRLRATPLHPGSVMISKLVTNLLVSLLGAALLVTQSVLFFKARLPESWLAIIPGMLLCCLSLFALGFALASLFRSANTVRAVAFVVFYPMMFFSGGAVPEQLLPKSILMLSKAMPMTYAVQLLRDLWFGAGWNTTAVLALIGFMLAGALISVRFFRWE